jgi:hypothetical protein
LQVGDTGPVESARRSNSRVLGSPFSGLSGHLFYTVIKILKNCTAKKVFAEPQICKIRVLVIQTSYAFDILLLDRDAK